MVDESVNISLNVVRLPSGRKRKGKQAGSNVGNPKQFPSDIATEVVAKQVKDVAVQKKGEQSSIWKSFKKNNKALKPPSLGFVKPPRILKADSLVKTTKSTIEKNETSFEEFNLLNQKRKKGINKKHTGKPRLTGSESDFAEPTTSEKFKKDFSKQQAHFKVTSLFQNNPEIPHVAHKAVKPIKEAVFSEMNFKDLDLHPYMVKNLDDTMKLTKMTTVQQRSIPVLLKGNDALIRSQTGSGKTLAFVLPILDALQKVRPKINRADGVLVLVVVPSRELALQTYEVFDKLVKSYTWIVPGCLIGGEKRKAEKARLRKGVSILVGTPGRLIDHMQNTRALKLDKVSWLVLDEADRLLDMGYEKDVASLITALNEGHQSRSLLKPSYLPQDEDAEDSKPKCRQTVLLSATLTPGVERLAGLTLQDPVFVDACDETLTSSTSVPVFSETSVVDTLVLPETLAQKYMVTPAKLRLVTLAALILWKCKLTNHKKMLVFIATQDMVDYHTELLSAALSLTNQDDSDSEDASYFANSGIEFFKLHGNMNQHERTDVFKTFRKAHSGVLLCTDVASRGLDLPEVDWVVQYTGPTSVADYVHRVGRTARGGHSGSSILFLTPSEVQFVGKLESSRIRILEEKMETCLDKLLSVHVESRSVEEAATKLQNEMENIVTDQKKMKDLACRAYSSWARFYSSYPRNMRDAFSVKSIHLGHYAKSFALRDPPKIIIGHAKRTTANEPRFAKKRLREKQEPRPKRQRQVTEVSEFGSGLEPIRKKKKT